MTRYVLHPGCVTSKRDGDRHFINGRTLAHLYGVDYSTCVFGDVPPPRYIERPGDVHLYPRYDGDYDVAKAPVTPPR